MMKATATKMSLGSKHLQYFDYFTLIPSCSHFTMFEKNATN